MKAIIENGGLDCTLYKTQRGVNETNVSFENRHNSLKHHLFLDLLFFTQILEVINIKSGDKEELSENMKMLFVKRTRRNLHGMDRTFSYDFLTDGEGVDSEIMGMEVWQADNPNRLIYVKF